MNFIKKTLKTAFVLFSAITTALSLTVAYEEQAKLKQDLENN